MGQVLRYIDAIVPTLISQHLRERTQRVRSMTAAELKELDF